MAFNELNTLTKDVICRASGPTPRDRLSDLSKEVEDLRKEAAASQDGSEDSEIPAVSLKRARSVQGPITAYVTSRSLVGVSSNVSAGCSRREFNERRLLVSIKIGTAVTIDRMQVKTKRQELCRCPSQA